MSTPSYPRVSRETQAALETYQALLVKWQARINLVAPDTVAQAWERHFLDSIQLAEYMAPDGRPSGMTQGSLENWGEAPGPSPRAKVLVDLGSGAGFPGLVLAIARPDLAVHLVESDAKKVEFLRTVSRETGAAVTIHHLRIEAVKPFIVDVLTARALAPLVDLMDYAMPFFALNPSMRMIIPKGAKWRDEVRVAQQKFKFTLDDHPSLTDENARVLIVSGLEGPRR
jgi:16S rRNA (guanine527-N7)-methyltransferase